MKNTYENNQTNNIRELYQQVIVDHNRNPRNFYLMSDASGHAEGFNPLCGDQLIVYIELHDEIIRAISFQGHGCAISMASASLMTEALKGKTLEQARQLFDSFHNALIEEANLPDRQTLGKLTVLLGVKEFPSRIKCATLAWHTGKAAINYSKEQISMPTLPISTE